jgi:peroxiredoxin
MLRREGERMSTSTTWSRRGVLLLPAAALATARLFAQQRPADTPVSLEQLPANLPRPTDDGGCRHLPGMALPDLELQSTSNHRVNLSTISAPRVVVYCYPMTGQPGRALPAGWDDIPGARGCTPETCGFRDHHAELKRLGAEVFGVSVQSTAYQQEMVARLKVPFEVLSDEAMAFTHPLRLPTFMAGGMTLIKRLTIVARNGRIEHVFYPVFPPDTHADEVIAWLASHAAAH